MRTRTILGLTMIGTAAALYAHRKNGGEMSFTSIKYNLKRLWNGIQHKAEQAKTEAGEMVERAQSKLGEVAEKVQDKGQAAFESAREETAEVTSSLPGEVGYPSSGGYPPGGFERR